MQSSRRSDSEWQGLVSEVRARPGQLVAEADSILPGRAHSCPYGG